MYFFSLEDVYFSCLSRDVLMHCDDVMRSSLEGVRLAVHYMCNETLNGSKNMDFSLKKLVGIHCN